MSRLTRRGFLGLTGGVVAATAAGYGISALSGTEQTGTALPSLLKPPPPFQVPLPIPPVLTPGRHRDHPGADYYEITDRVALQEIIPGTRTTVWGPGGTFPGPTVVSHSGRPTVVRRINALPIPTVAHLHGGHVPAADDGFPTDLVHPPGHQATSHMADMPGMPPDPKASTSVGFRDYRYPMNQRAATLWYHDHRMGFTGLDVWNGLAGFHIVRDQEDSALPLPSGDREIPLMIVDRSFEADASFRYPMADPMLPGVTDPYMPGVLGDVVLVNGAPWPVLDVAACRYRFRVLNASNARRYRLALGLPITQVGSDGGLLDHPVVHERLEIAPAERFDVVIDFTGLPAGHEVTLGNELGSGPTADVMRFRVTGPAPDTSRIPDRLAVVPLLDRTEATVVRDFTFQKGPDVWTVNGQEFDPARPLVSPRLGATEIWRFVTDFHHPVHVHLAPFQVLSRNGHAPGPTDGGWKDTIDLRPAELAEVIIRFTDHRGRYVLHCHNLEHEDMAMMAVFEVV